MHSAESLEIIESEGWRLLELAKREPDAPVTQYPGWLMKDLVEHTASIHARTVAICDSLPQQRIPAPPRPADFDALGWYESVLPTMLRALRLARPNAPVWTFVPDRSLWFWERRMLIETGIHRWDAQQSVEDPEPLLDQVAVAGLDEFNDMWLPRMKDVPALKLRATDLGRLWVLGSGTVSGIVNGTASDLYLRLMSRPGAELPEEWAVAVDSLGTPQGA